MWFSLNILEMKGIKVRSEFPVQEVKFEIIVFVGETRRYWRLGRSAADYKLGAIKSA
jgi:hypothetical protein